MDNFEEYIRQAEPNKAEKAKVWKTAIGLQEVDGLKPSNYLIATARQNIEGNISISEVKERIETYYKKLPTQANEDRTEEADKVSLRIAEILSEQTFTFSPAEYIAIHRRLFIGIYKFAGKIRDYNITKQEWVLDGETVLYGSADSLKATLEYDFEQEKKFNYKGLSQQEVLAHIANFISYLWQIHIFGEGNTRTTAVFLIKYLRTFGFEVNNNLFAEHSMYFRNALVRANYKNHAKNIHSTNEFLMRFFENLLHVENHDLRNREMHVRFVDPVNNHVNPVSYPVNDPVKDPVKDPVNDPLNDPVNDPVSYPVNDPVNDPVKDLVNDPVKRNILQYLKQNPKANYAELANKTGYSASTIKRHIQELKRVGLIERIGSDKTGYWKIISK